MGGQRSSTIHDSLRTLYLAGTFAGLTDGELLERFAKRNGDSAQTAFAVLVERHGGIVLSTCRAVLRDDQEAHDAFQATFLVLVRKAGSLWVRDSLGPWLHRVAYRVAAHARRDADRRKRAEREAAERASERMVEGGPDDVASVVHEEVDRLHDRYRIPVVLCDLEGRSYEDAARSMKCPVGTVKSRLARGRECLRDRLTRRGLAPTVSLVAVETRAKCSLAAVPPDLLESTARAATQFAAGGTTAVEAISASAVRHAEGVLSTMIRSKLTQITIMILAVALISGAGWFVASGQGPAGDPKGRIASASNKASARAVAKDQAKSSTLARELIGAWILVETPGKIVEPMEKEITLKFFGSRHWASTKANPKMMGEVIYHHGGTYKLDGDQYTETVEYAHPMQDDFVKTTYRFKIKVEGDTYTQIGLDNEYTEVYKRAK
jgi:RNA polymerase sigma factor (sigma-70 family)